MYETLPRTVDGKLYGGISVIHDKVNSSSVLLHDYTDSCCDRCGTINFRMTNGWLFWNFDGLGGLAGLTTTLLALSGYVSSGTVGLCITSAMTFTSSVYWTCRFWTALELDLKYVGMICDVLMLTCFRLALSALSSML